MREAAQRKRRPSGGGVNPKLGGTGQTKPYRNSSLSASDPVIRIEPEPFGQGFDVKILPPLADGRSFDQEHATYRAARGYAGGLRLILGLPMLDLVGERNG